MCGMLSIWMFHPGLVDGGGGREREMTVECVWERPNRGWQ